LYFVAKNLFYVYFCHKLICVLTVKYFFKFILRMKKKVYLLAITFSVIVSSCQQDEASGISILPEDAAREIGFVQMDMKTIGTRSEIFDDFNTDLGIKARIARKKTGCKTGFGLCDFRAKEQPDAFVQSQTRSSETNSNKYECVTTCRIDSTGKGITYFLLADTPESQGLTAETMPPFVVDEEIEQPIEEKPQYSLFAMPGAYPYQKSLGKYGGYAIIMTYNGGE